METETSLTTAEDGAMNGENSRVSTRRVCCAGHTAVDIAKLGALVVDNYGVHEDNCLGYDNAGGGTVEQ